MPENPTHLRRRSSGCCAVTCRRLLEFRTCGAARDPHLRHMGTGTFSGTFDTFIPLSRAQRLARLDTLARLLDTAFVVPGTNIRFGVDALIGLVPGLGDVITTALSLYIVREARALGASKTIIGRMIFNVAVDGTIGLVPVLGDLFDVAFRANRRNVMLLQSHLAARTRS